MKIYCKSIILIVVVPSCFFQALYVDQVALKPNCLLNNRSCPPNQIFKQTTSVVTTALNQVIIDSTEMETRQIFSCMFVIAKSFEELFTPS